MSALSPGQRVNVPDLDGDWTVWSLADECPGAYFVVPASGGGYAVIRAVAVKGAAHPRIELIRDARK